MIITTNLAMSYGAKILFTDVNLHVKKGNRYGLVGANGAGKSTFFKILLQEEEVSSGEFTCVKNARIGCLKQDQFLYENVSIINTVIAGRSELWQALQEKEELLATKVVAKFASAREFEGDTERRTASSTANVREDSSLGATTKLPAEVEFGNNSIDLCDEASGYRLAELEQIISDNDGYTSEIFAAELLLGLGIQEKYHYQPLSVLSGGYKLRVLLAQSLFNNPDILLLDEPTNHLDIISIYWLENYLKQKFKGALVFISHDLAFLNNIATHILDIDYGTIKIYTGNYDIFVRDKQLVVEQKLKEFSHLEKKIATMQVFVERFRALATRARQAASREKQIEKMELPDIQKSSRVSPYFNFKQKKPSGKIVLKVDNITKSYEDEKILSGVNFTATRGEKIVIIGPNGVGKSTLLKILVNKISSDAGNYEWGHEAQVSYFAQDHHELLNENISVIDWLTNQLPTENNNSVRTVLGQLLFRKDEVEKNILSLSGGEGARLLLAKIILEESNILILDEPTNHLDIEAKDMLKKALINYQGTLILVTHDRDFASNIATRIIAVSPQKITDFKGKYQEYLHKHGSDYLNSDWVLDQYKYDK